jgi:hypothetical protein
MSMSATPEMPSGRQARRSPSASVLRGLEVGALLQAVTELHLVGLVTDAEYRATRRRLAARI